MTLEQARKQYDDAVLMTVQHPADSITESNLLSMKPQSTKMLFMKVGSELSSIIFSRQAYVQEQREYTSRIVKTAEEELWPQRWNKC